MPFTGTSSGWSAAVFRFTLAVVPALFGATVVGAGPHPCLPDEPGTYRTSEFRAPVPCSLTGATVVSTEELRILMERDAPVLVDVFPAPRPPAGTGSAGHLWFPPSRRSLPAAVWLPNVGLGVLPIEEERYFRANLEHLTRGDRTRIVVFFCLRNCWLSWNAARRAVSWNYTSVIWYPEGTDGWSVAGHELIKISPVERTEGQ